MKLPFDKMILLYRLCHVLKMLKLLDTDEHWAWEWYMSKERVVDVRREWGD